MSRFGLIAADQLPTASASIFLALAAWLPLALLVTLQALTDESYSAAAFFEDPTVHTRYLAAIWLLVATERYADRRIAALLQHFGDAGLIAPDDQPAFRTATQRADRASSSALAEAILLAVAVASSIATTRYAISVVGSGWEGRLVDGAMVLSWAGATTSLLSNPLFLFLGLRWVWRFLVWTTLLFRISRLPLRLTPMHPDRAAGLGFLAIYPGIFTGYVFALSCVVASSFLKELQFVSHSWDEIGLAIGVWLTLMLTIFLGPLLVFWAKLYQTREDGILAYGRLATQHHLSFHGKWIREGGTEEAITDSSDPSTAADLNASVSAVQEMRFVPIDLPAVVQLLAAAGAPMLFVVIRQVPLADLLKWLVGTIL